MQKVSPYDVLNMNNLSKEQLELFKRIKLFDFGCWFMDYIHDTRDYRGTTRFNGKKYRIHSLFYKFFGPPIIGRVDYHHICRVKACVNPAHLIPLKRAEHTPLTVMERKYKSPNIHVPLGRHR